MKKSIICNLNPFNNETNMSSAEYIIKKILAFILIYMSSAILVSSTVFVLRRSNIWIACGLHSAWNFILYVIMGLNLSGSESVSKGVILFSVKDAGILNGAEYGIEASVITTIVLGMLLFFMVKGWKGRTCKNGISQ